MIRVYFLPVETIDDTEQVAGCEHVHDALLLTTENPKVRKLIMDTTTEEHEALSLLAVGCPEATQADIDAYNAQVVILPPDPDTARAQELLPTSPDAITTPEIWELLRILARRLGYRL